MGRTGNLIGSEYTNPRGLVYIKVKKGRLWRQCWIPKQRFLVQNILGRDLLPEERVLRVRGNKNQFEMWMFQVINYNTGVIIRFIGDKGEFYAKAVTKIWSNQYDKCLKCLKCQFKYVSRGLCSRCYRKEMQSIKKELLSKRSSQTFPHNHEIIEPRST